MSSVVALEQSSAMAEIGRIILPKANNATECLIQEISATGNEPEASRSLPRASSLSIRIEQGVARMASVVWWDSEAVGIRFTGK